MWRYLTKLFSSAFLPFSIHDFICTYTYVLPKTFPNYMKKLVDDENFSNLLLFYFWQVILGVRSKTLHMTLIFLLLGLMSIKGYQNLQQSYSRLGNQYLRAIYSSICLGPNHVVQLSLPIYKEWNWIRKIEYFKLARNFCSVFSSQDVFLIEFLHDLVHSNSTYAYIIQCTYSAISSGIYCFFKYLAY